MPEESESELTTLTEDEEKKLVNHAESSTVPQLWSPDGGKPMTIAEIVKSHGKATKDGKSFRPKKWSPIGLSTLVEKWVPTGKVEDTCICQGVGCQICK